DVPVVYFLNSANLLALTGSESAPEGNYSIVEETDEAGTTYLTTKPMELVAGNWQDDTSGAPYPLDPSISTMAQVDTFLIDNNIQPVDQNGDDPVDPGTDPNDPVDPGTDHENEGLPVFTLNVSQAETLTDDVVPAGSYALEIFQEQGGFEIRQLVSVIEVDGIWVRELQNGQQVIFQISSAHFPTTEAIDTYIDEQGLVPTGFITEDTNPGTDPNDPVDDELPVFELSSSQIFSLTGVPEQPAGNYAVWDLGNGWVDIEPVDNIDGQWILTEDEFDFIETDVEQFSSLEDVLTFLGYPDPLGFAFVDDFISESDAQSVDQPLIHTEHEYSLTPYSLEVNGEILSFGNNDDLIIGFQFSDSIFFENPEEVIVAETSNENVFSTNFELLSYNNDLIYFRAFA
ncbi:MAG: hypothetical protein EBS13_09415, partial [Verrucomicrobia bacterium]|nr:hypothetical protein [Verrucomicrobiota bacterium]